MARWDLVIAPVCNHSLVLTVTMPGVYVMLYCMYAGLVVVLLIFLACVYDYHGAPGPPLYVMVKHKKLQGVITQNIEPVQFIQQPHIISQSDSVQVTGQERVYGARENLNIQDINNQHHQAMVEDSVQKNQEESLLGHQGLYIPPGTNFV